ncbi:hypothetical protein LPJ73_006662 [Coemansia sp. RSA 2703]|nr:hypothetical protein LPJ73_006662 [Coemansia sp. RSA 2703]KAJ2361378.1 hypothetical protein IW150_007257 [Coemansia sp. RSA 2607]KAJ2381561.1 hypothetical protein GGI05_005940 [Coemansia sp. RSA 2603]
MSGGIGPQIPPEIAAKLGIATRTTESSSDDTKSTDGRSPDAGSESESESDIIGPTMPPQTASLSTSKNDGSSSEDEQIGPTLPPGFQLNDRNHGNADDASSSSEDEDAVGPSVSLAGYTASSAANQTLAAINERLKAQEPGAEPKAAQRSDWMLVPPSAETRKGGGKGNGTAAPLFDESWTETPEQRRERERLGKKKRKAEEEKEVEEETPMMRKKREEDEGKARWVEEYNREQRPKSLMEMHLEGQRKKQKKEKGRHGGQRLKGNVVEAISGLKDRYAPGKGGAFM